MITELKRTEQTLRPDVRPDLRPDLQAIADKILALRKMTKESGFQTGRSQSELLNRLNADDLAAVAKAVYGTK